MLWQFHIFHTSALVIQSGCQVHRITVGRLLQPLLPCRGPIHACRVDKQGAKRLSDTMKRMSIMKQLKQRVNAYVFVWFCLDLFMTCLRVTAVATTVGCSNKMLRSGSHCIDRHVFDWHLRNQGIMNWTSPHVQIQTEYRDIYNLKCNRWCLLSQSDFKFIKMWIYRDDSWKLYKEMV